MKLHLASIKIASLALALTYPYASLFAGQSIEATSADVPQVQEKAECPISFAFNAGYDSAYIFRGVNILDATTGGGNLVYGEVSATGYGFTVGAWYAGSVNEGFDGNQYNELDLYASYAHSIGPVTVTAGYIYYHFDSPLQPGNPNLKDVQTGSDTHEVSIAISTDAIPYVTPSLTYYYDFDLYEGGYLELKLASSFPLIADKVSVDPYALVSYDFDYNASTDWNHFQAGVAVPWRITEHFILSAYCAVSVAMNSLQTIGVDDYEVFGGARFSFTF